MMIQLYAGYDEISFLYIINFKNLLNVVPNMLIMYFIRLLLYLESQN